MGKIVAYVNVRNLSEETTLSSFGVHLITTNKDVKSKIYRTRFKAVSTGYELKKDITNEDDLVGIGKVIDIYGYKKNGKDHTTTILELIDIIKTIILTKTDFEASGELIFITDNVKLNTIVEGLLNHDDKLKSKDMRRMNSFNANNIDTAIKLSVEMKQLNKIIPVKITKFNLGEENLGLMRSSFLSDVGKNIISPTGKNLFFKTVTTPQDYWNDKKVKLSPLLLKNNVIGFNHNVNNIYHFINYETDDMIGRVAGYVVHTITVLREQCEYLKHFDELSASLLGDVLTPYLLRIRSMTSKTFMFDYLLYKEDILTIKERSVTEPFFLVNDVENNEIINEIYPPLLATLVSKIHFELLEDLDKVRVNTPKVKEEFIDITDLVFETVEVGVKAVKKLKVKKELNESKGCVKYELNGKQIKLIPALDLPSYMILNRMVNSKPKVILIVKKRGSVYRCSTVVLSDLGDIVTNNYHSNRIF